MVSIKIQTVESSDKQRKEYSPKLVTESEVARAYSSAGVYCNDTNSSRHYEVFLKYLFKG